MTDTTPTAFCQNCGKPLTAATTRTVGPATYCEPCLDARLHQAPPYPGTPPYPTPPSAPNPGIAALLGLIPGVGAMYNGQYAKGIVHLIVFVVLIALTNQIDLFGIFIAGWVCYMVIEAHHTARARRDHTPLPNPFGLNDIGERLGFGKAWPAGAPNVASVLHDAANAAAQHFQQHQQQQQQAASNPNYPPPYQAQPMPNQPPVDPFSYAPPTHFGDWSGATHQYAQNPAAGTDQPWRDTFHTVPPPNPMATSFPFVPPVIPAITGHQHRFPSGAIFLIAAGIFFLLATTGIFHAFNGELVVGLGLIALAAWLFFKRMLDSGSTLTADGSPAYNLRALRALRGAAWVGLTGVLFLFNATHFLRWNHSWPLYIILAGVLGFAERAAQHQTALYPPSQGPLL